MSVLLYLSELMIPFTVFYITGYGMAMKVPVYDSFRRGAASGLETVAKLAPTLIGLMTAMGVLRASGFPEQAAVLIAKVLPETVFPSALVPLGILKLFSSGAASGMLPDIYKQYGTDSVIGLTASLMMSSTETVFYTMSIYYTAAGIKKTRYTLCGALSAVFAGIAASAFLAKWMA